jgi:hypothetical protein
MAAAGIDRYDKETLFKNFGHHRGSFDSSSKFARWFGREV